MSVLTDSTILSLKYATMYVTLQRILNTHLKKLSLVVFCWISQHFSKNCMIISVVAAKIWYLKKCTVFIGPPCIYLKNIPTKFHPNLIWNDGALAFGRGQPNKKNNTKSVPELKKLENLFFVNYASSWLTAVAVICFSNKLHETDV